MFRLIKQPCTEFIPLLLAELASMADPESQYPLYVRNSNQGAVIISGSGTKRCDIQVWGAVSVNVHFYTGADKSETFFAGTTRDVKEAAQCIVGWFAE